MSISKTLRKNDSVTMFFWDDNEPSSDQLFFIASIVSALALLIKQSAEHVTPPFDFLVIANGVLGVAAIVYFIAGPVVFSSSVIKATRSVLVYMSFLMFFVFIGNVTGLLSLWSQFLFSHLNNGLHPSAVIVSPLASLVFLLKTIRVRRTHSECGKKNMNLKDCNIGTLAAHASGYSVLGYYVAQYTLLIP